MRGLARQPAKPMNKQRLFSWIRREPNGRREPPHPPNRYAVGPLLLPKGRRFYPRSFAPTAFSAAATTLPDSASISASVRVWSTGCTPISTASDFEPSGTPAPV